MPMLPALIAAGLPAMLFLALWLRAAAQLRQARREADDIREHFEQSFDAQRRLEREQAATAERERVFADLHDDLGAKLLTLIHTAENAEQARLARGVLQDFRHALSRSSDAAGTLLEVLAQIREETEQRLSLVGVALDWQQAADLPDADLDSAQALHLFRITREAVSNALRHAQPREMRLRSRMAGDVLVLDITDDGLYRTEQAPSDSRGMTNMRRRAAELQGSIDWASGTFGGTKVVLRFPLKPAGQQRHGPPRP